MSTDELNAVDIDMLDVAWDIESLIFLKKSSFHFMSPLRVIGDQVSKQHFGKQSLIGYRSNVGGRFIGTSKNINNVSIWQDHTS